MALLACASLGFMQCGESPGVDGGTGGGTASDGGTGGGSGGSGGGQAACTTADWSDLSQLQLVSSGFSVAEMGGPYHSAMVAKPLSGSRFDVLSYQFWWNFTTPANPALPYNETLVPRTFNGASGCALCIFLSTSCDSSGSNCDADYMAHGGSVTVLQGDQNVEQGVFRTTNTNLRFVEFDRDHDTAVANGRCVEVSSFPLAFQWNNPADGGVDGGLDDAGTDDAGTEDAGTEDAGTEDAGTDDAGTEDAGTDDAGTEDAGAEDAGADAGEE